MFGRRRASVVIRDVGLYVGGLLEHDVSIRSTHSERVHTRTTWARTRFPLSTLVRDVKRRPWKIDGWIGPLEVESWGNERMFHAERRLDEARDPGSRVEMTDVRFDRSQSTKLKLLGAGAKCALEGLHFDWIPKGRSRAVRFDVTNGVGRDLRHDVGGTNHGRLGVHAGSSVTDLARTIVVDGRSLDEGVDGRAAPQGVVESLEDNDTGSAAEDSAAGERIERPTMSIGRHHAARLIVVPCFLR